jgi:excisionase family DNA binding protein
VIDAFLRPADLCHTASYSSGSEQTGEYMSPQSNEQPFNLSVGQFIERFGVSRSTVYDMINAGELHAFKIRGRTLIPLSEVGRLQDDNKIPAKPASQDDKAISATAA